MHYNITKKITTKREAPYYRFITCLIILIAIPVIAVALMSFLIMGIFGFVFEHLKSVFAKRQTPPPAPPFYLEYVLLNNQYIKIIAVEDETDTELAALNEVWAEEVYQAETYLYHAKTSPLIPALEGNIICFFLKEQPGGALLQILDQTQNNSLPSTQLVFLRYETLQIIPIESLGSFYIYNDEKDTNLIRGFNTKQELQLYLS